MIYCFICVFSYLLIFLPDVNVDNPDKKSIMMYVMCYFQVLPHDSITLDEADIASSPEIIHRKAKPSEVMV